MMDNKAQSGWWNHKTNFRIPFTMIEKHNANLHLSPEM